MLSITFYVDGDEEFNPFFITNRLYEELSSADFFSNTLQAPFQKNVKTCYFIAFIYRLTS